MVYAGHKAHARRRSASSSIHVNIPQYSPTRPTFSRQLSERQLGEHSMWEKSRSFPGGLRSTFDSTRAYTRSARFQRWFIIIFVTMLVFLLVNLAWVHKDEAMKLDSYVRALLNSDEYASPEDLIEADSADLADASDKQHLLNSVDSLDWDFQPLEEIVSVKEKPLIDINTLPEDDTESPSKYEFDSQILRDSYASPFFKSLDQQYSKGSRPLNREFGKQSFGADSFPVSTLPRNRAADKSKDTKYIGYLPHSGFHNQRIELQNALLLGRALNRTVLIPPIWLGWPTVSRPYDELQQAWSDFTLSHPHSFRLDQTTLTNAGNDNLSPDEDRLMKYMGPAPFASNMRPAQRSADDVAWEVEDLYLNISYGDSEPTTNLTEFQCKSYSKECRSTYINTALSWDFLIDTDLLSYEVDIAPRWDMREQALHILYGIESPSDVFVIRDRSKNEFHFSDALPKDKLIADTSAGRFSRGVSIDALRDLPHKVLLLGSIFGSTRVKLTKDMHLSEIRPDHRDLLTASSSANPKLTQILAFRSHFLLDPASRIADLLGGSGNYIGIHARLNDGIFVRRAHENMNSIFWKVVQPLFGLPEEISWLNPPDDPLSIFADELTPTTSKLISKLKDLRGKEWIGKTHSNGPAFSALMRKLSASRRKGNNKNKASEKKQARSDWHWFDSERDIAHEDFERTSALTKRQKGQGTPVLPKGSTPRTVKIEGKLSSAMSCRGPLHTDPDLLPLNVPVYLATDSPFPEQDENLQPFYRTFPCLFTFDDFREPSETNNYKFIFSLRRMLKLVNVNDGAPLGRVMLPFLEAIVAAKARITAGTRSSTFSDFVVFGLHNAYKDE